MDLTTAIWTVGGGLIGSILILIGTIYTTNRNLSKTNSTEHSSMEKELINKHDKIDKEGHTYKKVDDTCKISSDNNKMLTQLHERQKGQDKNVGSDVMIAIKTILNKYEEVVVNNKELMNQNLEYVQALENLQMQNENLVIKNQELINSLDQNLEHKRKR